MAEQYDTVERMQGQERELVILSLASGNEVFLGAVAEFFFQPQRLNVSITRAKSKLIVIAPQPASVPERRSRLPAPRADSLPRDNSATLQRFFLDSEQEWAAKLDLEPAGEQRALAGDFSVRLINGVAGSGKTLIAIHRALLLARLFPQQSILLLIHNTPVVAEVLDRLHRVYGTLPQNVEIRTFFAWARRQWSRNSRRIRASPPPVPPAHGSIR